MSDDLRIVWDGVTYALPLPFSPRERVAVRAWTGLRGDVEYQSALEQGDGAFLAALVIVAKQRKGEAVNPDAILDDVAFDEKLGAPDDDEADPPTVAADVAADAPSVTTTTPEDIGAPS